MSNFQLRNIFLTAILTLGAFCARSQSASVDADTLRITPQMIDSIRQNPPLDDFNQPYKSTVFVPRGQWIAGISVAYDQSNQNNYEFLVLQGISGDTYSFKVSPMLLYAIKDDMAIGAKFSYKRALTKLENADIVLDSETSTNVDALYSLSHNFYGTLLYRNYFSLGSSKRFGFFNEIQLQMGGGESKLTKGRGEDMTGTFERNFSLDLGIVPGLIIFLSNYSAMEINVGVLGLSYTNTKSTSDRIYVARRHSDLVNFRVNLFSITFGATFYI